jgi:AAA domain
MDQKTVLARVFVPRKLRDVNLQGAALLPTSVVSTAQNSSHREGLRAALVPHPPEAAAERRQCCPLRDVPPQVFEADLYFAVKAANDEAHRAPPAPAGGPKSNNQNNDKRTKAKAKHAASNDNLQSPPPAPPPGLTLTSPPSAASWSSTSSTSPQKQQQPPSIFDSISNASDYCQAWEGLLWQERKHLLRLYERYAKYNMVVRRQPRSPRPQAVADIAGIADASPSLMPGDAVLVRTAHEVVLPPDVNRMCVPNAATGRYSPAPFRQHVELRCVLEHVTRQPHDVGRATGKVHFTWTDDACSAFLDATMHHPHYPNPRLYHLRFVPSWDLTVGCLSALDWLGSLPKHHANALFHTLLFPTSAPILPSENRSLLLEGQFAFMNHDGSSSSTGGAATPTATATDKPAAMLNPQQRDFCRLVERRAMHPSYESIREPLVCSGPAGTGKTQTMLHAVHQLLKDDDDDHHHGGVGAPANAHSTPTHNGTAPSPHSPPPPRGRHRHTQKCRILICTPSHTAADVITRRLGKECAKFLNRSTLFRLYNPNRPLATVPVDVLQYARQAPDTGAFCLPQDVGSLMKFRVIVCTCQDAHLLYRLGLTNAQLRTRRHTFEAHLHKVCEGTNLAVTIEGANDTHWTHLFIDEAAQATEPESLIPLSVVVDPEPGTRKVEICLVGDPRQLSPNVYSSGEGSNGQPNDLSRSWMERLLLRPVTALGGGQAHLLGPSLIDLQEWMEYSCRENLSVFLTMNYRGHPSFLMMPSALFYFDKLQSAYHPHRTISNWCPTLRMVESLSAPVILPTPIATADETSNGQEVPPQVRPVKQYDWPLHFRGVSGRDQAITVSEGFTSQSWTNDEEARAVTEIVQTLVGEGVPIQSIGVMAPFRGQVVRIRDSLRGKHLSGINVGTIEDYQSVERDVIVLSLTRATPAFVPHDILSRVGVFGQPKRSNVALTRAEHLFIVVRPA